MRALGISLVTAFAILLALPGLQMMFPLTAEESLSGVGIAAPKPVFTRAAWWSGELQAQAEAWFDEHVGFRGHAIRTDNQIGLDVFREASSKAADAPVLGRRMMIFEQHWLEAYDGGDSFRDRGLRKLARELGELQAALARRGIAFVLVVSPSKVATYSEYLPTGFLHQGSVRPPDAYERMLPMLGTEGVHLVDGRSIFAEEKARSPHALFPPGGIHWNRYGAYLVVRRAWEALEQQLGRPLVGLRCRAIAEGDEPSRADQETDVSDLLNVWHVGHADWKFPRPELYTVNEEEGFRPRLVVVGDSFWTLADSIVAAHQLATRRDFLYYFNEFPRTDRLAEGRGAYPGDFYEGMSWEHILSADAIVIEVNEVSIGKAGYGFIQQAQKNLRALPSPTRAP